MAGPDFFNQSDSFIIDVLRIDDGLVPVGAKTKYERVVIGDDIWNQVKVHFSDRGLSPEELSLSSVTMTDMVHRKVVQDVIKGAIHPGR